MVKHIWASLIIGMMILGLVACAAPSAAPVPVVPPSGVAGNAADLSGYCRAARQDDPAAQLYIGQLYYNGTGGVAQDMAAAMVWFDRAHMNGAAEVHKFRKMAGKAAHEKDFAAYRHYSRNALALPCAAS